jgi:hypothetical protein
LELDSISTEIVTPVICLCKTFKVGGDVIIKVPNELREESPNGNRILIECNNFTIDFSKIQRRPYLIKHNNNSFQLSINSSNKVVSPFDKYSSNEKFEGEYSNEFKTIFVKLRKILITFRSHSKGSMTRCKGKIDDFRISGHDYSKPLIEKLLNQRIIEEKGIMYFLNREETANQLGLTFNKLQATTPTPQMAQFINDFIDNYNN